MEIHLCEFPEQETGGRGQSQGYLWGDDADSTGKGWGLPTGALETPAEWCLPHCSMDFMELSI